MVFNKLLRVTTIQIERIWSNKRWRFQSLVLMTRSAWGQGIHSRDALSINSAMSSSIFILIIHVYSEVVEDAFVGLQPSQVCVLYHPYPWIPSKQLDIWESKKVQLELWCVTRFDPGGRSLTVIVKIFLGI